jgi:GDP-D-mannose dehydratase
MPAPPFETALILGSNGATGGYLARLLQARGVAVTGVDTRTGAGAVGTPDALAELGIAGDIAMIAPGDAARFVATGAIGVVFAINDAADAAAAATLTAASAAAAGRDIALCHVVDLAALRRDPARRALARQVTAWRVDGRRRAANAILHRHDSRLGAVTSLPAIVTDTAFRIARGDALPLLELVETGPCDWGWTAEYVDAVQRLAGLAPMRDFAVASGQRLTTADLSDHAFGFFGLASADHVRIAPAPAPGDAAPQPDTEPDTEPDTAPDADTAVAVAALQAATGWSASTGGRDFVRALCEGAASRGERPA